MNNAAEYHAYYDMKILGYIDLALSAIIIITNTLVILVFTRKKGTTPIDIIFIHIAITESLAALSHVPRAIQQFIRATLCSIPQHRTKEWENISFQFFAAAFLFRTAAVWLTIMLSVWRYIAIIHPLKARIWCNMKITRILIITGYIFSVIITTPAYLSATVGKSYKLLDRNGCLTTNFSTAHNETIYEIQIPLENFQFRYKVIFLSYAIIKIAPSLIFAVISYKLVIALIKAKKNHEKMTHTSCHNNRATVILILIFFLFAIGQVPYGIGDLFNVVYGTQFFWKYHFYVKEIFNTLMLIAMSLNFVVYYVLSNQFRRTFRELFCRANNDHVSLDMSKKSPRDQRVMISIIH